ncbi:hypothetical protein [Streptomyces liangshanensis]|uniref:hypothetical protein n=1 Tax=Streptomyces liangshanensis TaxID=2717324 RepID=UPI0036D86C6C
MSLTENRPPPPTAGPQSALAPAAPPAPPRTGPPHTALPGPRAVTAGLVPLAALVTLGALAGGAPRDWLDRMAGVVALVALSASVMLGLTTVFRDLLRPAHRRLAQHAHRTAGLAGLAFLVLHIAVKAAGGRVTPAAALGVTDLLTGLGTLAAVLFVLAAVTGIWRGVFATRRWIRPFRVLHGASYAAWLAAVAHGLTAGRAPAPWVVACYALCLAAASAALIHRWTKRS